MKHLSIAFLAAALSCGPQTLRTRLNNAEKQATRAERFLDEAEAQMAMLEPDAAIEKLNRARVAMGDPDVGYYPERESIARRIDADEAKLPQVRREREKREIQLLVGQRERDVDAANAEVSAALENVGSMEFSSAPVERLKRALSQLRQKLEEGRQLETKDVDYSKYVQRIERDMRQATAKWVLASNTLAFIEGPGGDYRKARECVRAAKRQKKARRQVLLAEAGSKFRSCAISGRELIVTTHGLGRMRVTVDGNRTFPAAVASECHRQAEEMNKLIAALSRPSARSVP